MSKTLVWAVNTCRFVLAATFLFSGFVKANDPLGTTYKIEDYLAAWSIQLPSELFVVMAAIGLAFFEFILGVYLFFGMRRRQISVITLIFMTAMTLLTVYIAIANPVSDCGCFGDAIVLTNTQTLLKNIVLLAAAVLVFRHCDLQKQIISKQIYWIISITCALSILAFASYCIYAQPLIDFRPYKIGADLRQLAAGKSGEQPQFNVTIVYKRDGETLELSIDDDDPDSTWTYVETRRTPVKEVNENQIVDFYIQNDDEDVTQDLLATDGYLFLLIAPTLPSADESIMDRINDAYDYTQQNDMEFYCLTASGEEETMHWTEYTGAEYLFYTSDERTLKTIVRANPGLVILKDGVIIGKWSNWNFPSVEEIANGIVGKTQATSL